METVRGGDAAGAQDAGEGLVVTAALGSAGVLLLDLAAQVQEGEQQGGEGDEEEEKEKEEEEEEDGVEQSAEEDGREGDVAEGQEGELLLVARGGPVEQLVDLEVDGEAGGHGNELPRRRTRLRWRLQ